MKHSLAKSAVEPRTRHLAIELLEPRTYLASDVIYIASQDDPSANFTTSILRDPSTNTLSFANPSLEFFVTPGATSPPPIFESFNLDDPELTIVVKRGNDLYQDYRLQSSRGDTWASVDIRPDTGFTIGQVLVGVRRVSDPVSAPWLATQLIDISVLKQNPAVDLSLTATTPDGAPIDELHVGDDFVLHVWAQDVRKDPHGVFAAYMNLNWNSALAGTTGQPSHGEHFSNGISGSGDAPGVINHIGGFGGNVETKGKRLEVFSVPMHAMAAGNLSISSRPDDRVPDDNILEYGIDTAINFAAVQFGKLSIHIADAAPGQTPKETTDVPVVEPIKTPPGAETPAVDFSLSATTLDGVPIDNLHVGDAFVLHVWAQDTRNDARGVFAAYLNLNWDTSLAALAGDTVHGEHFSNEKNDGKAAAGSLNRVGGFGDGILTKADRNEVFSVPMRATAAGELSIATSSAPDVIPFFSILEYGVDGRVPDSDVLFGKFSIHIATASPAEPPPNTADTPTLAPTTSPENEPSTNPTIAVPTIVVTAPADSHESTITVDLRDLLFSALQAAIASPAAVGIGSPSLLLKSAESGSATAVDAVQSNDRTSDLSVAAKEGPNAASDDASNELASTAKLELSLL